MKFIFTLTAGRTGTAYLCSLFKENLSDAEVHHELIDYTKFGVDTPDLSHFTLFNSIGNTEKVKDFWKQKFDRIKRKQCSCYVETSHLLMKAGLVENLYNITNHGHVHLIALKRDFLKTVISYRDRYDFSNLGNMWLWYLDYQYPRNLVNPQTFAELDRDGIRLWYLFEIQQRVNFYKEYLKDQKNVSVHEVAIEDLSDLDNVSSFFKELGVELEPSEIFIPPPQNENTVHREISEEKLEALKNMIELYKQKMST